MISEGSHIGYYRGTRGGKWIVRHREAGASGPYATTTLGVADDLAEADGENILSFKHAVDQGMEWIRRQAAGGKTLDPNMTVGDAVMAYIGIRDQRTSAMAGRPKRSSASYTLGNNVMTDQGLRDTKLRDLSEADLRAWQRRIAIASGSTKQRVANDLKAALNLAFEEHRRVLPTDLPVTIKYGLKPSSSLDSAPRAVARDNQVLDDPVIRKILVTGEDMDPDGDHFTMSLLLAATGARFSQLARMIVADVQPSLRRVMVPPSRKGKGKATKPIAVQVGDDVMRALLPLVDGRDANEALLLRWRYRQIKPTVWERVDRRPWQSSSEMMRWWRNVVEAAGVPGVIPYALRHSSIVRQIRANLPIRLVAALHDTSVLMIERHYARWIAESLDELAARAVIPLLEATSGVLSKRQQATEVARLPCRAPARVSALA